MRLLIGSPKVNMTEAKRRRKEAIHQERSSKKEEILLERMHETEYELINGMRHVLPYYAEHKVCAKERWFGLPLSELFQTHLSFSAHYLDQALKRGLIFINDAIPSPDYCIRRDDVIRHNAHRHEPAVLDHPIHIVADTKDILVVSKPPSIPIHPTGAFRHNTLLSLLAKEHGYTKDLYPLHRIDRLTSGLLLIGRHPSVVRAVSPKIEQGHISKKYVARVSGLFPRESITVDEPIEPWPGMRVLYRTTRVGGKSATTTFQRLHVFSDSTSLVLCIQVKYPELNAKTAPGSKLNRSSCADNCLILLGTLKTGRTHQIRVHLKHIGFPIANDPAYGPTSPPFDFIPNSNNDSLGIGDDEFEGTASTQQQPHTHDTPAMTSKATITLEPSSTTMHQQTATTIPQQGTPITTGQDTITTTAQLFMTQQATTLQTGTTTAPSQNYGTYDDICEFCTKQRTFTASAQLIWLHAYQYESEEWKFEAALPSWAAE